MGHPKRSEGMEIPIDIIPNILLRLSSKDFVRSSCVCKLWRSIVADPSFRKLHVAHHAAAAASSEPEILLVSETGEPGRSDEASIFDLSSAKALSQIAIPNGYRFAGVCNDLLCFALNQDQAPAVVCNPITGEMLQLPKAPLLPDVKGQELSHHFILGFSASTTEYKMFRFSFSQWHRPSEETNYIAVYTLGGGGWRQYSYLSGLHPVISPAPVHIDGNIFVATANKRARAARMLVLDVATETHRSYRIPYSFDDYREGWHRRDDGGFDMLAEGFDLNGKMCIVVNIGFYPLPAYPLLAREKTQFWVMKPPAPGELLLEGKEEEDDDKMYWDLRYSLDFDGSFLFEVPRGAWIDQAQRLHYRIGDSVYRYDTRGRGRCSSPSSNVVDSVSFDERLDLPGHAQHPPRLFSHWLEFSRWSVCGGYRPSLLSPLLFALPPSQDEKGKKRPQSERTLTHAFLMPDVDGHTDGI